MWCVGPRARTYCRPCSRSSPSLAAHATLSWLTPQQNTRLGALDLATPAVAVETQQAISVRDGVLVQYGERRRIKRGWRAGARGGRGARSSGAACWPKLGGPQPCKPHRIDKLEPELRSSLYIYRVYFLAVSGQFHDLVERTKNRLRGRRARSGGPSGRA
jgi:hypothetical protein